MVQSLNLFPIRPILQLPHIGGKSTIWTNPYHMVIKNPVPFHDITPKQLVCIPSGKHTKSCGLNGPFLVDLPIKMVIFQFANCWLTK